ncbi:MAG: hypothetical protein NTX40_03610, partial [Planctomycetota bacterium]|nr:hypothetical protein [Planctomycetota bacterium]
MGPTWSPRCRRSVDWPGAALSCRSNPSCPRFWEQSARLVMAPRVWELAPKGKRPKTAMLFWQHSLYGSADLVLTPKPVHGPRGELLEDCWSRPADLYRRLAES